MECPVCGQCAGYPFSSGTTIERAAIRVAMPCQACAHEWFMQMETRRAQAAIRPPWPGPERRKTTRG